VKKVYVRTLADHRWIRLLYVNGLPRAELNVELCKLHRPLNDAAVVIVVADDLS
jgi:hypothetical protein